jgi:hypothetical protein
VEADREETAGRGIGLDVEREDTEPRRPVGGEEIRVLEDEAETGDLVSLAVDLEGTAAR